ncbi:MAG TPA: NAD(P)-binding domain-containing protein [Aquihabitans sp.]|jgi:hypothetical protein|nr:NAD(P)-binding domain-containing protein [Aquihabitans sp.]
MTTIGLIGAGNIGSQVARLAVDAGFDVVISNSRGPDTLAELVEELGPAARAATAEEAAEAADVAVVTVPLKAYRAVPVEPLAGKVVIDTNNYYAGRDGRFDELEAGTATSSELLQRHLPTSKVVKGFNHIHAADLTAHRSPAGTSGRRALALAGDDAAAKATVADLFGRLGFDAVDVGPLAESWRVQPDTPAYGPRLDADGLAAALAAAERPAPT